MFIWNICELRHLLVIIDFIQAFKVKLVLLEIREVNNSGNSTDVLIEVVELKEVGLWLKVGGIVQGFIFCIILRGL
jgi:hypothetical protein